MSAAGPIVYLVDDDAAVRKGLVRLLTEAGFDVRAFDSPVSFLACSRPDVPSCLILDQQMPEQTGLELQQSLQDPASVLPIIFLSGHGDIATSVEAMKRGAFDFLTKPVDAEPLIAVVNRALDVSATGRVIHAEREAFATRAARLTPRERDVCVLVLRGLLNKQVAGELGISDKTVKIHRANAMAKLEVGSVAELSSLVERTGILRPFSAGSGSSDPGLPRRGSEGPTV
jgi:FixJ family two-component response regulator